MIKITQKDNKKFVEIAEKRATIRPFRDNSERDIRRRIAKIKGVDYNEIAEITTQNARNLFQI